MTSAALQSDWSTGGQYNFESTNEVAQYKPAI